MTAYLEINSCTEALLPETKQKKDEKERSPDNSILKVR